MRGLSVSLLLALALVSGALASGAAVAQSYSTVEERMTGAEFKAAGLEKLSPEELAALNAWLEKQSERALAVSGGEFAAPRADRMGFEDAPMRREIRSRLVGEFTGWSGSDEFTLENGQVWKQIEAGTLAGVKAMTNPQVTIRPGMLGGWTLQVEGYNTRAKVKRIK